MTKAEEFTRLWETMLPEEIAQRLGVEASAVYTRARNLGIMRQRYRPDVDAAWARAAALIGEGLPALWVAEDTGLSVYKIRKRLKPGGGAWTKVWPTIRVNEALLALHREFAPTA